MKSLEEQVVLITGATDGIGKGVATKFAKLGACVLLHGRDVDRLAKVRENIIRETKNEKIETHLADFSALEDVRKFATAVRANYESLDVLINNAGIGRGRRGHQIREVSADGFELRFQVNHLAPFLLEHLLLPVLRAKSPSRIVNVASASQDMIDFDDMMLERSYDGTRAYSQSKLAMVMSTFELAKRLDPSEITVNALHPGSLLDTKIVREAWGSAQAPVEVGVESEFYLATSPDLENITGNYFDQKRRVQAHPQAYDEKALQNLWQTSNRLTNLAID